MCPQNPLQGMNRMVSRQKNTRPNMISQMLPAPTPSHMKFKKAATISHRNSSLREHGCLSREKNLNGHTWWMFQDILINTLTALLGESSPKNVWYTKSARGRYVFDLFFSTSAIAGNLKTKTFLICLIISKGLKKPRWFSFECFFSLACFLQKIIPKSGFFAISSGDFFHYPLIEATWFALQRIPFWHLSPEGDLQ